jgi:3-deoxy-D-manno-octulosonic-acid transferase
VDEAPAVRDPLRRPPERHTVATGTKMGSQTTAALYVALMVAVIVAIDVLFFKNRFWERLTVNVGIVLVFVACYYRFLKHP